MSVRPGTRTRREIGRLPLAVLVGVFPALVLAPSASTHPPALVAGTGKEIRGQPHRWLHQSRMPLVNARIQLVVGGCPGVPHFSGCVFTRRPRRIYLRPDARSPRSVLYHELGHSFDLTLLRYRDRRAFRRILHVGKLGWFAGSPPPSERFAEAYALCARFGTRRPAASKLGWSHSAYAYQPTRGQHRAACELIQRAGAKRRQRRNPKPQPPANAPPIIEQRPPEPPPKREPPPKSDPFPDLPGVPGSPPLPVPPP
jgi:hypothetical protein